MKGRRDWDGPPREGGKAKRRSNGGFGRIIKDKNHEKVLDRYRQRDGSGQPDISQEQ